MKVHEGTVAWDLLELPERLKALRHLTVPEVFANFQHFSIATQHCNMGTLYDTKTHVSECSRASELIQRLQNIALNGFKLTNYHCSSEK